MDFPINWAPFAQAVSLCVAKGRRRFSSGVLALGGGKHRSNGLPGIFGRAPGRPRLGVALRRSFLCLLTASPGWGEGSSSPSFAVILKAANFPRLYCRVSCLALAHTLLLAVAPLRPRPQACLPAHTSHTSQLSAELQTSSNEHASPRWRNGGACHSCVDYAKGTNAGWREGVGAAARSIF